MTFATGEYLRGYFIASYPEQNILHLLLDNILLHFINKNEFCCILTGSYPSENPWYPIAHHIKV